MSSVTKWLRQDAAAYRHRKMQEAEEALNRKESRSRLYPDSVNLKSGVVTRYTLWSWGKVGDITKRGEIVDWAGRVIGRVVNEEPEYGKECEE